MEYVKTVADMTFIISIYKYVIAPIQLYFLITEIYIITIDILVGNLL